MFLIRVKSHLLGKVLRTMPTPVTLMGSPFFVHISATWPRLEVPAAVDSHHIHTNPPAIDFFLHRPTMFLPIHPGQPSPTLGVGGYGPVILSARLQVLEVFKGDPGPEITVVNSDGLFRKGNEFLIYAATRSQNPLAVNTLARTNVVTEPYAVADLVWLRAYPTAPPTASIFGSATLGPGITDTPTISVTLTGPTALTASPSADHTYTFKDLPPGAYTVTTILPAGYTTARDKNTAAVTVAAKGCAEVDFPIRYDTHIRGLVTDAAGNPAPNVPIGLLKPAPAQSLIGFNIVNFQNTGPDGRYDFAMADPGDYWVAFNYPGPNSATPYVPVYYPSGSTQASAQLIHLGALDSSATRDNINLVLLPPLTPVTLHVHVVNPDGSPVKANVIANDSLTPNRGQGFTADANGNADITLFAGRSYTLVATTYDMHQPSCAGPVKFTAAAGLQLGTLTLDKTTTACSALKRSK